MAIKIIVFGQLAEIIGSNEIAFPHVEDTDTMKRHLQEKFPGLLSVNFKIAVDRQVVNQNTTISLQSTLALLPPFSGG